jgi:hypothetical protein
MKKVFTLIALAVSLGSFAQQVPNGGFESWTNPKAPDSWGTFGNVTGAGAAGFVFPYFAIKDTAAANHVEGLASLKLITDTFPAFAGGFVLPSTACLGTLSIDAMNNFHYSGVAYAKRPDSLYFSYKYAPAIPADTAIMEFYLQKKDTSLMGGFGYAIVKPLSTTHGSWVNVKMSLAGYYTSPAFPDTLQMLFFSSTDTAAATFGSSLWIDAIHFESALNVVSGIEQLAGEVKGVNAYPNPATDHINLAIQADEVGSQVQLFDMEGRMVYSGILNSTTDAIDTRSIPAGVYAIRVNSVDKLTTYKGKIALTK